MCVCVCVCLLLYYPNVIDLNNWDVNSLCFLHRLKMRWKGCGRKRLWPVGFITPIQCVKLQLDTDL